MDIPQINISPEILRLVSEIDEFKGKWQATNYVSDRYLLQLEQARIIDGCVASMKLLGIRFATRVVRLIFKDRASYAFNQPQEKQVLGYIDVLEYINKNYQSMDCSESYLKQLHVMLQRYSVKPLHVQGGYKRIPNKLVSAHQPGCDNPYVLAFDTVKPFESPTKISTLMCWIDKEMREEKLHPLVLISIWLGMFFSISPFQEGNKRIGFVFAYLILLKSGYSFVKYNALEPVFEQDYDVFYETLSQTQKHSMNDEVNWHKWVVYFLRCIRKQKNELLTVLDDAYYHEQDALNILSLRIMELFNHHSRLTIRDIVQYTGANRNTVKLRLRELTRDNYLLKHGKARATWYTVV